MKSIKFFYLITTVVLVNFSCKKDETLTPEDQHAADLMIIEHYLEDNNLSATRTPTGLHYIVTEVGPGEHPSANDEVEVKYKGYFTDGRVFDQTQPATTAKFFLTGVIPGWTEGIPYLRSGGGKGIFLLPSSLGYGNRSVGSIPPNSVLIFEVDLIAITG